MVMGKIRGPRGPKPPEVAKETKGNVLQGQEYDASWWADYLQGIKNRKEPPVHQQKQAPQLIVMAER